jgi:hypothetical protein
MSSCSQQLSIHCQSCWLAALTIFRVHRARARDIIHDVTNGQRHVGGISSHRAGRLNGNNVRKRPKIGNFSGPIETFQCIKSNRDFNVKIWKVFIYLHLDFLGNFVDSIFLFLNRGRPRWNRKVKPLRLRQSATIQKQKNRTNQQSFFKFQGNLNEGKWIPSKSWCRSPSLIWCTRTFLSAMTNGLFSVVF